MGRILALIGIVFVVALVLGMRNGKEHKYERMHATMIRGCADSAGRGLPAETAQSFCACTIDKLVADVGYEKIDASMQADPARNPEWLNQTMQRAARHCADKLGLQYSMKES